MAFANKKSHLTFVGFANRKVNHHLISSGTVPQWNVSGYNSSNCILTTIKLDLMNVLFGDLEEENTFINNLTILLGKIFIFIS